MKAFQSVNSDEHIERALADRNLFVKNLFERPNSFVKILPYQEYIPESGVFILKDGSIGAVFEVALLEHEPVEAVKIVEIVEQLKSWFSLNERCTLQVLFDQSYISARDPVWRKSTDNYINGNQASREIYQSRVKKFKGLCEGASVYSPLKRRTFLSIRYFPDRIASNSIRNIVERGESLLFDTMNTLTAEVAEFAQLLDQFKESSKIPLTRIDSIGLVDFLRQFFNPKEYLKRDFAKFNSQIPISEQIVFSSLNGSLDGLKRENIKTRTITLKTSPRRVIPGGMANFLTKSFPFKISLNFSFPPRTKVKSYFDLKEFFLQNSPSAKAKRQQAEVKEIQQRLAHDERCLFMTFCVIVEGETDEILNQRSRQIMSVFHNDLECEVIKEELIGLGLCLNALPLFYTQASDHSTQRYIRIMNKDAVNLLPVFDSFKGIENPLQLFLSRENNLVQMSWLTNKISNHTAILGHTGSGKSNFAIDCVQAMKLLDPEPLAFVIDKRASCEALCKRFDGTLNIFDPNKAMPFSPFRGIFDDQKIEFLTKLILTAVTLTSSSFEKESHHLSIISRSLKEAYLRKARERGVVYKDGELSESETELEISVSMDDVISSMSALTAEEDFENLKEHIEDLISKLMPFYGDGVYSVFFREQPKKRKRSSEKLLMAYDLEALDADKTLQVLMSMSVIHEIMTIMRKTENQKRGGVLYIEELGCLGRDNAIVGEFIVEAAERMRKMGFSLIGVAPNPRVYFETEAGKAVWEGASNFFFLNMTPDQLKYLTEKSNLLGEGAREIVASLKTKESEYSEVYFTNKDSTSCGAFRYIQSGVDRENSANSERDKALLEHAEAQ